MNDTLKFLNKEDYKVREFDKKYCELLKKILTEG